MTAEKRYLINQENIARHTITDDAPLHNALCALNALSGEVMTLFVVDNLHRMVGTLTDGDVRRGLIAGHDMQSLVKEVMHKDFKYLRDKHDMFSHIKELKKERIELIPILDNNDSIIEIIDLRTTSNILPLDAVLMAGGKGERLQPLTLDTPKPLLKIGDKAIIDYNVDELIRNGVSNIYVTVNYLHQQIENHFRNKYNKDNIKCVLEPTRLGTIGAVALIEDFDHDNVLVMNSDLLTTISYEEMFATHIDNEATLTMAVIPYSVSVPFAIIDIDDDSVKGLTEKPTYNYFANAGIYIIKREALKRIKVGEYLDAPDFIRALISNGEKVSYYPINGTWIDIGSHNDFKYACELMSRPISNNHN